MSKDSAGKVLLVDDEPIILRSTRMVLEELGFEVATVSEAAQVVSVLRRERPDVLLQDVRMPGLDLAGLMEAIRADPEVGRTPVVLFSASMDLQEIQARVGAAAFLEKPFHPPELSAVISRALGRAHAPVASLAVPAGVDGHG